MYNDAEYNRQIEELLSIPGTELAQVEKDMGFTCKQDIGELIYAIVTHRLDISFPLIKLS